MKTNVCTRFLPAVLTAGVLYLGPSTDTLLAQSEANQIQTTQMQGAPDADVTRIQLSKADQFLDGHPEIAEQLQKNPTLVNDAKFVQSHPALQRFFQQNPAVREEFTENPNRFMGQEQRYDRREDRDRDSMSARQWELRSTDQFLDGHPEIAEQLKKNPALVNDPRFVQNHPDLQQYLQQHPGVREEFTENPNAFMHQEQRYDRREDNNVAAHQWEIKSADQFLDGHPEIAEQLRKNPSLISDQRFVQNHPDLQQYLQQHPGVREEFRDNPNAFMHQEQRYDRQGDQFTRRPEDAEMTQFHKFCGEHPAIAQQLSKNPSLASNQAFLAQHPELQEFMKAHPQAAQQMTQNPQGFSASAQTNAASGVSRGKAASADPKPKQK